MTSNISLGLHVPLGLRHLIAEGISLASISQDSYKSERYIFRDGDEEYEEEIVATKSHVVWSRGNAVRAVYSFELEEEPVRQAFLTHFRPETVQEVAESPEATFHHRTTDKQRSHAEIAEKSAQDQHQSSTHRALVVLLSTKIHIYMLHGTHHVTDLPFPISKAFPMHGGMILQRPHSSLASSQASPEPPRPPQNSFFSSQSLTNSSFLQSPTLQKSLGSRALLASQTSRQDETFLDGLWKSLKVDLPAAHSQQEDTIFTLCDPLAELGLVAQTRSISSRLLIKQHASAKTAFDVIDPAEELIWVSDPGDLGNSDLVVLVTQNAEQQTLTLWHGWFCDGCTLREAMNHQKKQKADKSRRRSSFLSASMGTGTATPAVRTHESFANAYAGRTRAQTSQAADAVFASALDLDIDDDGLQTIGKDGSRRISSIVSRGELNVTDQRTAQSGAASSFTATSFRRNASMGLNERRSLGLRRSRASTPGSILGRSSYPDEDDMELDINEDKSEAEALADAIDEITATFDNMNADVLLGLQDEGWRQDFIVRKFHSVPVAATVHQTTATVYKVLAHTVPAFSAKEAGGWAFMLYITSPQSSIRFDIEVKVKSCSISGCINIAIPLVKQRSKTVETEDIFKIVDHGTQAIAIGTKSLILPGNVQPIEMPKALTYLMHMPLKTLGDPNDDHAAGKHRNLIAPNHVSLLDSGISGTYDELESDGLRHRRQLQLTPTDPLLKDILEVFELISQDKVARSIRPLWIALYSSAYSQMSNLSGTACSIEWVAMIAAIFCCLMPILDKKSISIAKMTRIAAGKHRADIHEKAHVMRRQQASTLFERAPWSKLEQVTNDSSSALRADQVFLVALALADDFWSRSQHQASNMSTVEVTKLVLALHVLREEQKLDICQQQTKNLEILAALIAQLGKWLNLDAWSFEAPSYYQYEGAVELRWSFIRSTKMRAGSTQIMDSPIGVMEWLEHSLVHKSAERYPTLVQIAGIDAQQPLSAILMTQAMELTPRTAMLSQLLEMTYVYSVQPQQIVEAMSACGMTNDILESLPVGISAPCREAIKQCECSPPLTWSQALFQLVGREDMDWTVDLEQARPSLSASADVKHDLRTICTATEQPSIITKSREADRNAVSQLIFHEDRRLVHAAGILHFNTVQIAECAKKPEWSDAFYFEQQRRVMQYVSVRTIALPTGDAMLHFGSQTPLMTERYHLPGFTSSCIMQPAGHTVTMDRSGLTEDKLSWAYFHAGASTGLRISRQAVGIDTSWLVFNKPNDLTNRHAGLLLALGLNGHLKHIAKWLSFKYLTPKHAMTSLGLLLGLAASNIGTMDSLITRMLSVHITCMLPMGAVELNVSPLTQTAGLIGIGLLYHNTHHRRMSETMLQEIEAMGDEDPDNGPDILRDESYRLAAGFSLGFINLGNGSTIQSLHGMHLEARLLRIAVGARPIKAVHVFDQATAGAIMALALVYMKTGDEVLARKIDVPDTEQQFEYIRPDMLMLRAMSKHLILWHSIEVHETPGARPTAQWISAAMPACCKPRWAKFSRSNATATTTDLPFFYIVTGLAWAVSLKYAGSGNVTARDEILLVLDMVWHCLRRRPESNFYYDSKTARIGLRRCVDVLALFAASVMAGTGDVQTFRYLRRLHGKTDAESLYGSHLASHMGIGLLFLSGGTMTVGTSNLAIAALICSLYPLFPTDVQDNRVHLQALRHLWVFAVEPRCLMVQDIDTKRSIQMPICIRLKNGKEMTLSAPCLLPDLYTIAALSTTGTSHWPIALDFSSDSARVARFRSAQTIFVKQCPPSVMHKGTFWSSFASLRLGHVKQQSSAILSWLHELHDLANLQEHDVQLLTGETTSTSRQDLTVYRQTDDLLLLMDAVACNNRDKLWDLKIVFAWAEQLPKDQQKHIMWLSWRVVQGLRIRIDERQAQLS